ncbi:MAG: VanZ family protein [Candidatus Omnitrophota bacterium]
MEFTQRLFGRGGLRILILLSLVCALGFFLAFLKRKQTGLKRFTLTLIFLFFALFLWFKIKLPQERIHILEYAILGWFAAGDLIKSHLSSEFPLKLRVKLKSMLLSCALVVFTGILDEKFQGILPYRVFDLRDIIFNCFGGSIGIALYEITNW